MVSDNPQLLLQVIRHLKGIEGFECTISEIKDGVMLVEATTGDRIILDLQDDGISITSRYRLRELDPTEIAHIFINANDFNTMTLVTKAVVEFQPAANSMIFECWYAAPYDAEQFDGLFRRYMSERAVLFDEELCERLADYWYAMPDEDSSEQ